MPRSLSCLLVLMLSACGQSGALYLPDRDPPTKAATSTPVSEVPAPPAVEIEKDKKDPSAATPPPTE